MNKTIFAPRSPGEITGEDLFCLLFFCSLPAVIGIAILCYAGLQFSAVACALTGVATTLIAIASWLPRKPEATVVVKSDRLLEVQP